MEKVTKVCANCVHWRAQRAIKPPSGECRAHPPKMKGRSAVWPETYWSDWCGEMDPGHGRFYDPLGGLQENSRAKPGGPSLGGMPDDEVDSDD